MRAAWQQRPDRERGRTASRFTGVEPRVPTSCQVQMSRMPALSVLPLLASAGHKGHRVMPAPVPATTPVLIRSLVPARMDRLPWSRFHTRVVVALGVTWVLDGLEITIASLIGPVLRSEEHTSELQSHSDLVCRLLLEKKKNQQFASCTKYQFNFLVSY